MKQHAKPWIAERIVQFFNQVKTDTEITALIKDNPATGTSEEKTGYGIGSVVAKKIIHRRQTLPANRFRNLEQILSVPGMGPDKLQDVIFTFDVPAAETFKRDMYQNVIFDNWILSYHSTPLEADAFHAVVNDEMQLRNFVKNKVIELAQHRNNTTPTAEQLAPINNNYIEFYQNPHYESFAFALWFYRFDADNWFTFRDVQETTERYLSSYQDYQHRLELHLFKGFKNTNILVKSISADDLPVVINHAEKVITIWTSQLND